MLATPLLDEPYDLDGSVIDGFRREGHAYVPGLASTDELALFRQPIERAGVEHAWDTRPMEERDTYGKAFLQAFNLWERSEVIEAFTFAPRFARVAAELMGVDSVRLYHDQALFKEAHGGPTPWHQDQHYWPLDTQHTITMWMPLVDVPEEVGTMTFVSGTHRMGNLVDLGISDESERAYDERVTAEGWPTVTYGPVSAGDATFHAGWTLHRAGPNPTDRMRTVMTVIYVDAAAIVAEPVNDAQKLDLAVWLRDSEPGGPIIGDRNPVLWPLG